MLPGSSCAASSSAAAPAGLGAVRCDDPPVDTARPLPEEPGRGVRTSDTLAIGFASPEPDLDLGSDPPESGIVPQASPAWRALSTRARTRPRARSMIPAEDAREKSTPHRALDRRGVLAVALVELGTRRHGGGGSRPGAGVRSPVDRSHARIADRHAPALRGGH